MLNLFFVYKCLQFIPENDLLLITYFVRKRGEQEAGDIGI